MKKFTVVILFVNLFVILACENNDSNNTNISINPNSIAEVFPSDDSIPEDLIIRLKRTTCYGTCPAYMLTIKADGKVNFFGQHYVETKGQAQGEISEDKIKQLIKEFKKIKFFELKDNYTSENCSTDTPSVRTTLFIADEVKKIEHDLGCDAPKELTVLEGKIDEIVGTKNGLEIKNECNTKNKINTARLLGI